MLIWQTESQSSQLVSRSLVICVELSQIPQVIGVMLASTVS